MRVQNVTKKAISYKEKDVLFTVGPGEIADVSEKIAVLEGFVPLDIPLHDSFDLNCDGVVDGKDLNLLSNKVKTNKKVVPKKVVKRK